MDKHLLRFVVGLLSLNLLFNSAYLTVVAESSDEPIVTPPPSEPDPTPAPEPEPEPEPEPQPNPEPEPEPEPNPDPGPGPEESTTRPPSDYNPPPTPTPPNNDYNNQPIEPLPPSRIEVPAVVEEVHINETLLTLLLEESIDNVDLVVALEDFIALQEEYTMGDVIDETPGTPKEEIIDNLPGQHSRKIEVREPDSNYVELYYGKTRGDASVKTILYFDEDDNWIGAGILQQPEQNTADAAIHPAFLARLVDKPPILLFNETIFVESLYQTRVQGRIFTTVLLPSEIEGQHELVVIDESQVRSHETINDELIERYSFEGVAQARMDVYLSSQYEEIETTLVEETFEDMTEEKPISFDSLNAFVERHRPVGTYSEDNLISMSELEQNYRQLAQLIEQGKAIKLSKLKSVMKQETMLVPGTDEDEERYDYYAIQENRVYIVQVTYNHQSDRVVSVRLEDRSPMIEETFPISIEDLHAFATREISPRFFVTQLGNPSIKEYLIDSNNKYRIRYVWTRLADPSMISIELIEYSDGQRTELYYYDAMNTNLSDENATENTTVDVTTEEMSSEKETTKQ